MSKCSLLEHSLADDKSLNKSALAQLFGEIGDQKIVENIGECEKIRKNQHFSITDQFLHILILSCQFFISRNIVRFAFQLHQNNLLHFMEKSRQV